MRRLDDEEEQRSGDVEGACGSSGEQGISGAAASGFGRWGKDAQGKRGGGIFGSQRGPQWKGKVASSPGLRRRWRARPFVRWTRAPCPRADAGDGGRNRSRFHSWVDRLPLVPLYLQLQSRIDGVPGCLLFFYKTRLPTVAESLKPKGPDVAVQPAKDWVLSIGQS
jgi:hypothetical protein